VGIPPVLRIRGLRLRGASSFFRWPSRESRPLLREFPGSTGAMVESLRPVKGQAGGVGSNRIAPVCRRAWLRRKGPVTVDALHNQLRLDLAPLHLGASRQLLASTNQTSSSFIKLLGPFVQAVRCFRARNLVSSFVYLSIASQSRTRLALLQHLCTWLASTTPSDRPFAAPCRSSCLSASAARLQPWVYQGSSRS
jgi:hypothetical protein